MIAAALNAVLAFTPPASATPLDSQIVIRRYARALLHARTPRALVFSYTVSQAGPIDIEQSHRIYRSGDLVRDETLMVDGIKQKSIRIARYRNRYTLQNLAPRATQYTFMFDGVQRSGSTLQYAYHTVSEGSEGGFAIDAMVVDGRSFLPVLLRFHAVGPGARGSGTIVFERVEKYWVPQSVTIEAIVRGKKAREHLAFSGYRFPASLPTSTFQAPRRLPTPAPAAY